MLLVEVRLIFKLLQDVSKCLPSKIKVREFEHKTNIKNKKI